MRGSSEIPKSDINATSMPETTADANAELKNTTEPYKRQKTRKPPLVQGRQPAYLRDEDAKTSKVSTSNDMSQTPSSKGSVNPLSTQSTDQHIKQHTAPVVSSSKENFEKKIAKSSINHNLNDFPNSLAFRIQPALIAKDLNQLEIVMKGMEENNLRFDRPPLLKYREIKEFIRTGINKVIDFREGAISDQAENLLIRMIRLGCTANAADKSENSVLILACKEGRSALVKTLLTECPDLRKDWLNVHGQNAATMAHKYGNVQLYTLLEQAGISPTPENPAITMYLNSFDMAHDESSNSEIDEYLDLFEENNYLNLPDENGQTLLFHAVIHEDVNFVLSLCNQKQFLNVALHDKNEKSVFDYISQIKDPATRSKLFKLIYNKSKQAGWLYELASYNYLTDV